MNISETISNNGSGPMPRADGMSLPASEGTLRRASSVSILVREPSCPAESLPEATNKSKKSTRFLPNLGMSRQDLSRREGTPREEAATRATSAIAEVNKRMRRHVIIEIERGRHHIREWHAAEVLRRVHSHNNEGLVDERSGCLTYRDVRQVFSDRQLVPSLEVRRHCILLCFSPLTAIILHDAVLLYVTERMQGSDSLIRRISQLSENRAKRRTPFEYSALECLLSAAIDAVGAEVVPIEESIARLSVSLKSHSATTHDLEELHKLKGPTAELDTRIIGFDKSIQDIMDDATDMLKMELSRLFERPEFYDALDHQLWDDYSFVQSSSTSSSPVGHNSRNGNPRASTARSGHSPTAGIRKRVMINLQRNDKVEGERKGVSFGNFHPNSPSSFPTPHYQPNLMPNADLTILLEYFDQEIDVLLDRISP